MKKLSLLLTLILTLTCLPAMAAEGDVILGRENRLLVFSFPEISGRRTLYIATRKHAEAAEPVQSFLRFLRAFYAPRSREEEQGKF